MEEEKISKKAANAVGGSVSGSKGSCTSKSELQALESLKTCIESRIEEDVCSTSKIRHATSQIKSIMQRTPRTSCQKSIRSCVAQGPSQRFDNELYQESDSEGPPENFQIDFDQMQNEEEQEFNSGELPWIFSEDYSQEDQVQVHEVPGSMHYIFGGENYDDEARAFEINLLMAKIEPRNLTAVFAAM